MGRLVSILWILAMIASSSAYTAETDPQHDIKLRKAIEARMAEISGSDQATMDEFREQGRSRTILCKTCHGADGMAVQPNTPNLAGQNPVYIIDQFQRFADGRRNDFMMSSLAKSFKDKDKINIALYYSNLEMKLSRDRVTDRKLLKKGNQIFSSVCVECHGADGKGQEGYARLAGQRADYVVKMLKEFRDRTGRRTNPWMTSVAIRLSDSDMAAVAAYVSNL